MMECTVLAEIGPENVECISHISVLGTVPAIVPDIPATVPELFLEMIHCNFTKMYFRPSVNHNCKKSYCILQFESPHKYISYHSVPHGYSSQAELSKNQRRKRK